MAALTASGCCEKDVEILENDGNDELVTFSVSVPMPETRSVGDAEAGEKSINHLQVLVFNKHGVYEASAVADKGEVSVTCTAGEKKMVALVNAKEEVNVPDYESLADRPVYLEDSGEDNLVMLGDTTVTVAAEKPITVEVSYLSSKVVLNSVTLNLDNQQHRELPFAVTSVFLTNVAGDRKYINPSTPSVWFHEGEYEPQNTLSFLHDQVNDGAITHGGPSYDTDHYFYCYQNATETRTRLVIETRIDKGTYYYPIELEELLPNTQYSYSVVLTRLGADSPDDSLEKGTCTVNVSIKGWNKKSSTVTI